MYYGEKVKLRALKKEDIELALEYLNNRELKKLINLNIAFPMSLEEEENWFETSHKERNGCYNFAIEDLETGTYIGGCSTNHVNWFTRVATIGIMIGDSDYWGKGYGTDALKVLTKFIFEEMNLNKIKLNVFSYNERAIKCYEKCGFKIEGIHKKEIFREGNYYDDIVMGLFKEDWEKDK